MSTTQQKRYLKPETDPVWSVQREGGHIAVTFGEIGAGGLWVGMYLENGDLDFTLWNGRVESVYHHIKPTLLFAMLGEEQ